MLDKLKEIETLCQAIADIGNNCEDDLCGDHRKNYNPRIRVAEEALIRLYPREMAVALEKAQLFL